MEIDRTVSVSHQSHSIPQQTPPRHNALTLWSTTNDVLCRNIQTTQQLFPIRSHCARGNRHLQISLLIPHFPIHFCLQVMSTRRLTIHVKVISRNRRDAALRHSHGVTTVRVDERQRTRTNVVKHQSHQLSECRDRPEDAANQHHNSVGLEP